MGRDAIDECVAYDFRYPVLGAEAVRKVRGSPIIVEDKVFAQFKQEIGWARVPGKYLIETGSKRNQ